VYVRNDIWKKSRKSESEWIERTWRGIWREKRGCEGSERREGDEDARVPCRCGSVIWFDSKDKRRKERWLPLHESESDHQMGLFFSTRGYSSFYTHVHAAPVPATVSGVFHPDHFVYFILNDPIYQQLFLRLFLSFFRVKFTNKFKYIFY